MNFLTEIQEAGYRLNDAMAYNFRCTSNTRKDCSNLDARALSYHSYGLAVDINVVSNPELRYYPDSTQGILTACAMPMKTNIPQWVVQTAQKWGLLWGGYGWSGGCASPMASKSSILRDPMHFEFRGSVEDAFAIARFNGVQFDDPAAQSPDAGNTDPLDGKTVKRVHGADRFGSAAATASFWPSTETVYLATGTNFPDSLAAGVTAARVDAPVLLVTADAVPASTMEQLSRLRPRTVYVAGGPAVISDAVVATASSAVSATLGQGDTGDGSERHPSVRSDALRNRRTPHPSVVVPRSLECGLDREWPGLPGSADRVGGRSGVRPALRDDRRSAASRSE